MPRPRDYANASAVRRLGGRERRNIGNRRGERQRRHRAERGETGMVPRPCRDEADQRPDQWPANLHRYTAKCAHGRTQALNRDDGVWLSRQYRVGDAAPRRGAMRGLPKDNA